MSVYWLLLSSQVLFWYAQSFSRLLNRAQIVLNHTYNTYDSEPAWRLCSRFVPEFSATVTNWLPAADVIPLDNTTLRLSGVHSHLTTIVDTVINETGAPTLCAHACRMHAAEPQARCAKGRIIPRLVP